MVGILGRGNRNSPSFDLANSRTLSSEAPASRDILSHASVGKTAGGPSHFFSLPNWTRRILSPSSRKHAVDEHGTIASGPRLPLNKNKDLPDPPRDAGSRPQSSDFSGSRVALPSRSMDKPPRRPSTATMARPNSPSKRSDIRNDTVVPIVVSPARCLRPSKSSNSLRSAEPTSGFLIGHNADSRTRTISLAAVPAKSRGGATLLGTEPDHPLPSYLNRKPSFWSRKVANLVHPAPSGSPSLPAVKPTSPFKVNFESESDTFRHRGEPSSTQLKRRHSDKAFRRPSTNRDLPPLPLPNAAHPPSKFPSSSPVTKRPATADSSTRLRAQSGFTFSSRATNTSKGPSVRVDKPINRPVTSDSSNVRPRSSTNPPLLHRLSMNLFSPSPTSGTKSGGFFGNSTSSPITKSPRPSLSQIPAEHLKPLPEERPDTFVQRLTFLVSKADIASVLASSGQAIYADSLKLYLGRFAFSGDPLDVALRRLLMDVGLPRETQQIDRVIEAFAKRYMSCNPNLFSSSDHPYILAFSLIMLHTDAFNKSNRRKMTKADYVKNTSLPGLIPDVLDCFYDNIVFAPFVFIEDPMDSNGVGNTNYENLTRPSTPAAHPSPLTTAGNTLLSRPKIDPYYLIMNNLLDQLRVKVEEYIPSKNPFRWDGTRSSWDYDEILLAFSKGLVIAISFAENTRLPAAFFGLTVGGFPGSSMGGIPDVHSAHPEIRSLKIIKVAILHRKDDVLEGGKKPNNRKWRPFCVVLTQSQILLFRDLNWNTALLSWNDIPKPAPFPSNIFKPDEIIPIKDAIAVFDGSYTRHAFTFRLVASGGRHILFQATSEEEMNDWLSCINYASAFKSTSIRLRSLGMSGEEVELTGIAAAATHLHHLRSLGQPQPLAWGRPNFADTSRHDMNNSSDGERLSNVRLNSPAPPEVEGALQFKETFDAVRAGLAATHLPTSHPGQDSFLVSSDSPNYSMDGMEPSGLSSRSQMIHLRVHDLEAQICATKSEIDSGLRFTRNVAVLAPFQKSTRDRLQEAIQAMSKNIQTLRLDITKLTCHRNILLDDLAAEARGFKKAASLALRTATETLHNRAFNPVSTQVCHDTQANTSNPDGSFVSATHSFDSSSGPSFRTALDLGPDWPSSGEAFATSTFRDSSRITESPLLEKHDGSLFADEHSRLSETMLGPDTSFDKISVASESPEEQAEEWNKTKAAKRVSLVRLPSDLRLSIILGKPTHRPHLTEISPVERSLSLS